MVAKVLREKLPSMNGSRSRSRASPVDPQHPAVEDLDDFFCELIGFRNTLMNAVADLVHDIKEAMRKHQAKVADAIREFLHRIRNHMNAGRDPAWGILFRDNHAAPELPI